MISNLPKYGEKKCNIDETIWVAFGFYLRLDKWPTQSKENARYHFFFFLNSFIYTGKGLQDKQMNASFHQVPVNIV